MRAILLIAIKDLKLLFRERMAAFFTFGFPLAVAFFFGVIFGGAGDEPQPVQVAVLVQSEGASSAAFVKGMEEDGAFTLMRAQTLDEGKRLVAGSDAVALVVIPKDFDERSAGMMTGNGPEIELIMDPSRKAEGGLLTGKLAQISFQTMFARMSDASFMTPMAADVEAGTAALGFSPEVQKAFKTTLTEMPKLTQRIKEMNGEEDGGTAAGPSKDWMPVQIKSSELQVNRDAPTNAFAISFLQGIAWGLFGAVLSFTGGMVEERERGTLLRLLAAPIRPMQMLMGKAAACFVTCVFVEVMLVTVGVALCGVRVSSVPLFALATLATAFAFTGIMMMLASIFRTQGGAQGAGRAVLLVLAMIGGGTVPLFVMPPIMRTISGISPFKWAVTAAEGATWRALPLESMATSLWTLVAIGAVCTVVAALAMRRRMA